MCWLKNIKFLLDESSSPFTNFVMEWTANLSMHVCGIQLNIFFVSISIEYFFRMFLDDWTFARETLTAESVDL